MEMPEGWHNCFDCDTSTDRGREYIDNALFLMKEMAETLNDLYYNDRYYDEDSDGEIRFKEELAMDDIEKILKKFNEWK